MKSWADETLLINEQTERLANDKAVQSDNAVSHNEVDVNNGKTEGPQEQLIDWIDIICNQITLIPTRANHIINGQHINDNNRSNDYKIIIIHYSSWIIVTTTTAEFNVHFQY